MALHFLFYKLRMGRFEHLVKNLALIELFKEKYHIPQEVSIRYYSTEGLAFDREVGEVIIPIIAFIEGGMTIPMGRITGTTYVPIDSAPNNVLITSLEF